MMMMIFDLGTLVLKALNQDKLYGDEFCRQRYYIEQIGHLVDRVTCSSLKPEV